MSKVRMHANRNLRPRVLSSGERRGIANYFAASHGGPPDWWKRVSIEYAGDLLGVIENVPSSPDDAIILTSQEVVLLTGSGTRRLRYDDIATIARLEKEPMSEALRISRKSGEMFELPVRGRSGAIGDVLRFLLSAARELEA